MRIINQKEVYKLFGKRLNGRKFKKDRVIAYLTWSQKGTSSGANITYFIRDRGNNIVGSIDLQRVNEDTATVGFWADKWCPGFITNSLHMIISVAKSLGYTQLDGYPEKGNFKSERVLKRCGFELVGDIKRSDKVLLKYIHDL